MKEKIIVLKETNNIRSYYIKIEDEAAGNITFVYLCSDLLKIEKNKYGYPIDDEKETQIKIIIS